RPRNVRRMRSGSARYAGILACVVALVSTGCSRSESSPTIPSTSATTAATGIHKIKHVVMIMQENRSFDSYFGTFPGADGIPMERGEPLVCAPDPKTRVCIEPFHDPRDRNVGGPHDHINAVHDINHRLMDGFVWQARAVLNKLCGLDP